MKFRVNDGHTIQRLEGQPNGEALSITLVAGDQVEGPPWWAEEFSGRMTPLDDQGQPIDLSIDLPTAKALERVSLLEDMIARNPTVAEALQGELAKAQADATSARAHLAQTRAERTARQPVIARAASIRQVK